MHLLRTGHGGGEGAASPWPHDACVAVEDWGGGAVQGVFSVNDRCAGG
jgi:hypothetical protein